MKNLTSFTAAATVGLTLLTGMAQADVAIEGQLIENVTFDCRGTINYLIRPNSNNPSFVGHVQTIVDLPESAGGGSWALSGVVELGQNRGESISAKQQTAPIDRCYGRGELKVGSCSTFSGVNRCEMQLDSSSFRLRFDRGNKGLYSMDGGTMELYSTSSMGTELYSTSSAGTE